MTSPSKLLPALLGGLFIGVLSVLPFVKAGNGCCCLWIVLGGVLAAYVMQQNHPLPITAGDGLAVGLLAGLTGGLLAWALALPVTWVFNAWAPGVGRAGLLRTDADLPADVRDQLHALMGDQGQVVLAGLMNIMVVTIDMMVGAFGGLLGVVFFRKPSPPAPPPPPPAPPSLPGRWGSSPEGAGGPDAPPPVSSESSSTF